MHRGLVCASAARLVVFNLLFASVGGAYSSTARDVKVAETVVMVTEDKSDLVCYERGRRFAIRRAG